MTSTATAFKTNQILLSIGAALLPSHSHMSLSHDVGGGVGWRKGRKGGGGGQRGALERLWCSSEVKFQKRWPVQGSPAQGGGKDVSSTTESCAVVADFMYCIV